MEMTGVAEAAQFINVVVNGTETMLKLTGEVARFSAEQIKQLVKFLYARKKEIENQPDKLEPGEQPIDKLLEVAHKNKDGVGLIQIKEEDKEKFVRFSADNKIPYSFLFDANKTDDMIEVTYPMSHTVSVFEYAQNNRDRARLINYQDYLKNATPLGKIRAENLISQIKNFEKDYLDPAVSQIKEKEDDYWIQLDPKQIVGMNKDTMEISVVDANNSIFYIDFPVADCLQDKEGVFTLNIGKDKKHEVYSEPGFEMYNDRYYDLRSKRTQGYCICDSKEVANLSDYSRSRINSNMSKEKVFTNSKTGESLKVNLNNKDIAAKEMSSLVR